MSLIVDITRRLGSFTLDAQFEAENGVTCLLGASGCGKSFTLKCIAGIERPDRGHIELDGAVLFDSEKHINLPPQKRQVGYLFQNYALFPNMTVRQNILCGLNREKDRDKKEKRLSEIIRLMQLDGLENHKPAQLSGGQQQRTALARILVSEPRLLMLDEPFSALDAHLRDSLKIELRDMLQEYGREVLMVTHSREEAYNMSRRIAVMDRGKLLCIKDTKELFADPGSVPAAVLTGCKKQTAQEVGDNLTAVGIRAHYFNVSTQKNRYPVTYVEEMEEPFEVILQFRYQNQTPDSPPVWWRLNKEKRPGAFPGEIGIAPANILLLY